MNLLEKFGLAHAPRNSLLGPRRNRRSLNIIVGEGSKSNDLNQERLYKALTRGMKPCRLKD